MFPFAQLAAVAFASIAGGAPAGPSTETSSNWAGYAVTAPADATTPSTFTDVTATWVQPRVTCTSTPGASSAFWVGLGGFSDTSQALEQTGTSADCTPAAKPVYYAWYEIVPAPPVRLKLKVAPGNRILGAVLATSSGRIVLELKNLTRKTVSTRSIPVSAPDLSSAEWIAEAPSICNGDSRCTPVPLANFGSVGFSSGATTANGHTGTIADPAWEQTAIDLVPETQRLPFAPPTTLGGATPSDLDATGRAFTVAWQPMQG